jgi:hypothetical protein
MKTKLTFFLIAITIIGTMALNFNLNLQNDNDLSLLSLANIEALAQENTGNLCPNGGYYSTGKRTSNDGIMYELIQYYSGGDIGIQLLPTYEAALAVANAGMSIRFEIRAFMWVEYNCDGGSGNCVVCNRYRV